MPVVVRNLYDTLNDFYRQLVDDFIVMMVNQQKNSSSDAKLAEKTSSFVDLDFLVSDSHVSRHFAVPKKWTRDELYDRGF